MKEVAGKIREARRYWDAHRNKAARRERELALELYSELTEEEKKERGEKARKDGEARVGLREEPPRINVIYLVRCFNLYIYILYS